MFAEELDESLRSPTSGEDNGERSTDRDGGSLLAAAATTGEAIEELERKRTGEKKKGRSENLEEEGAGGWGFYTVLSNGTVPQKASLN